jgi:hypothetical protein
VKVDQIKICKLAEECELDNSQTTADITTQPWLFLNQSVIESKKNIALVEKLNEKETLFLKYLLAANWFDNWPLGSIDTSQQFWRSELDGMLSKFNLTHPNSGDWRLKF